ncbi:MULTISPECIES: glycosyltransferase N-terminal domain-containing protein [unclassified Leeuwenhoekiella]|uniref:3-deoxy-D-manno-octulosonic acid transferase n=1 Tax=unclassified Leeuwenhoekiella TaxID=2615029 RepID=UPI0025BD7753|nr:MULTISPECIES: glycosyltransferase N-terminal domain-containing protein [unclassified Leeuwenhoekiella]|tara:strand:- start:52976 stop:54217 length:1242 start_codon:yes stop_codon:yes gene_type:complete
MRQLYSFLIQLFEWLLPVLGLFSAKLKGFRRVRQGVFSKLKSTIDSGDQVIWIHAASLGEYEQVVPVLENLREDYAAAKIVLTFFSPSGYTVRKDTPLADVVTYLPLDTARNARQFIKLLNPTLALFVKYEFWPNYLNELKKTSVHTLLISGVFRENQPFFKWYGSWMKQELEAFNYFFLQNEASLSVLTKLGYANAAVSGDTRFDRVSRQRSYDNSLDFIKEFKQDQLLLVCGSTWPEDENLLIDFINKSTIKVVVAPHKIDAEQIARFMKRLKRKSITYTDYDLKDLSRAEILVLNHVGLLSKVYAYADVAYVGGAAGNTGLHNILEPATFGIPILTGIHIKKFQEAQDLQKLAGLFTVSTPKEASQLLNKLVAEADFRHQTGMIAGHFISSQTGATQAIRNYLKSQTLTA